MLRQIARIALLCSLANVALAEVQPTDMVLDWKPRFLSNSAPIGDIHQMLVFDDGTGPALYVAGRIRAAGGKSMANLARWDGVSWTSVGNGLNGPVSVLAVYEGKLIAAGSFTAAGDVPASAIAQWDGSAWSPLGSGVSDTTFNAAVYSLQAMADGLYVAGVFDRAGGVPVYRIARWNDGQWTAVANNDDIWDLAEYRGQLAGRRTDGVYLREAGLWRRLGPANNGIHAMTVHSDELYISGRFPEKLMRWGGSGWIGLQNDFHPSAEVTSMLVQSTGMTVFGDRIDGSFVTSVARWNGVSWLRLPPGAENLRSAGIIAHDGALLLGARLGLFSDDSMLGWNGQRWTRPGPGLYGSVSTMIDLDGDLVAGGRFNIEGPVPTRNLARWTDQGWSGFGDGPAGNVSSILRFNDRLYVAGSFSVQGVNYGIAVWDGQAWSYELSDSEMNVLVVHEGALIAMGRRIENQINIRFAYRRTAQGWVPMWQGLTEVPGLAMAYQGQLLAIAPFGSFRWDGSTWAPIPGLNVPTPIRAAVIHQGNLVIASGEGDLSLFFQWNGTVLSPMTGSGGGKVRTMLSQGNELYIATEIQAVPGVTGYTSVRRWTPAGWVPVADLADPVGTMIFQGGDLLLSVPRYSGVPIAAFGLAEASTIEIVDVAPQPALINEPVRIRVRVSGTTAPGAGVVSVTGAPGGACSDTSLSPVGPTSAEAECTIRWNTPGARRLTASYTGGGTRSRTWRPSVSADFTLQVVSSSVVFGSGFEATGETPAGAD